MKRIFNQLPQVVVLALVVAVFVLDFNRSIQDILLTVRVHLNFGHHPNLRTREIKESAVLLFHLCFMSKVRNFVVKRKTTAL